VPVTVTPVSSAEISRLRLASHRLARRLRKHAGAAISPSQLAALTTLQRHGPLRLGQLADREQISRSSTTRLAGRLEEQGLAARTPDTDDGRSAWIAITAHGLQLLEQHNHRADEYLAVAVADLDPFDRTKLLDALPVLERLLDARR
jgi:DNA-binding MarR family transcriptional regulator